MKMGLIVAIIIAIGAGAAVFIGEAMAGIGLLSTAILMAILGALVEIERKI